MTANSRLHLGDCLDVLRGLSDASCALVYLDPPFFTQRRHTLTSRAGDVTYSFDDTWPSASHYATFLTERLAELRRVLTAEGSIFFHCDRSSSHLARAALDRTFGEAMFRAEIIWHYRRWSNTRRGLLPQHQTILWYSKSKSFTFNPEYEPYSPATNVDQLLQQRERRSDGKAAYARSPEGSLIPSKGKRGVPLGDVWDIPYLNPKASERTGYPTQKPVLLLERVIRLASDPGDLVLDPFCGSGTTLVAAALLGRPSLGIDTSPSAIALAESRLRAPTRTESRLLDVGRDTYEQVDSEALSLLQGLGAIPVQRNKGIDALVPCGDGQRNALIRVQRSEEPIDDAIRALERASQEKMAARLIVVATRPPPRGFRPPPTIDLVLTSAAKILEILVAPTADAPQAPGQRPGARPSAQQEPLQLRVSAAADLSPTPRRSPMGAGLSARARG